ncbi:MAG: mechanosensitive ion channel [Ferruginibacter sp.]|nr:mechanosensitive ion channel [Ferruginibacter sp.]
MDILDRIILDNSIRNLLIVSGAIALISLFRKTLSKYLASLLYLIIGRSWPSVEKQSFIGLIFKPLGWFLTILISFLAIAKLNFPSSWNFNIYEFTFHEIIQKSGICLIIIYFIRLVRSFIDFISLILESKKATGKDKGEDQLIVFFRDFLKTIAYIIGLLLILKAGFNVNLSSVLTGLSIVGAALALAAKESIENLIASFIIFFDKPFFTGDTVKINNVNGVVEHIGLRSTRIRTTEKTLVSVPNKQMVDSVVDNWSKRTERRAEIKFEFAPTTPANKIEGFIKKTNTYLEQKSPDIGSSSVYFADFSKNSVCVAVEFFTLPFSMAEFLDTKQQFNLFAKKCIEEEDMKLNTAGNDITILNSEGGDGMTKINSIV